MATLSTLLLLKKLLAFGVFQHTELIVSKAFMMNNNVLQEIHQGVYKNLDYHVMKITIIIILMSYSNSAVAEHPFFENKYRTYRHATNYF